MRSPISMHDVADRVSLDSHKPRAREEDATVRWRRKCVAIDGRGIRQHATMVFRLKRKNALRRDKYVQNWRSCRKWRGKRGGGQDSLRSGKDFRVQTSQMALLHTREGVKGLHQARSRLADHG